MPTRSANWNTWSKNPGPIYCWNYASGYIVFLHFKHYQYCLWHEPTIQRNKLHRKKSLIIGNIPSIIMWKSCLARPAITYKYQFCGTCHVHKCTSHMSWLLDFEKNSVISVLYIKVEQFKLVADDGCKRTEILWTQYHHNSPKEQKYTQAIYFAFTWRDACVNVNILLCLVRPRCTFTHVQIYSGMYLRSHVHFYIHV